MFWAEIWKNIRIFYLKMFIFLVVKFSIYLNKRVFVMGWKRHMSHSVRKRIFEHARPVKIQISLCIRAVWSESSQCAFLDNQSCKVSSCGERRLICGFIGYTCQKVRFLPSQTYTVKPVLVVTSIKQPTCIKEPEESCPKIHIPTYLNCIKQPPAFSSQILSFP